jgi:hypothetical protein
MVREQLLSQLQVLLSLEQLLQPGETAQCQFCAKEYTHQ